MLSDGFLFFSVMNLGRLFNVGEANELSVFDGLRVLSMLWVVLGHVLAVQVRMTVREGVLCF